MDLNRNKAKSEKCFIVGLARNIGKHLPRIIPDIERLGRCFLDYRVRVYENDSIDNTKEVLDEWAFNNSKVNYIYEQLNAPRLTDLSVRRIDLMSSYRNKLLEHFFLRNDWYTFKYFMVIDLDLYGFSIDGILNSIGHENWDCITSNGRIHTSMSPYTNVYYDIFALRETEDESPNRHFGKLQTKYKDIKVNDGLIPVSSAFNGLAIYKTVSIVGSKYYSIPGYAEHAGLHQQMSNLGHGRIFINPSQLTYYDEAMRNHYVNNLYIE